MTQWYINEFSKINGLSKRTLHYYDAIEILKPSIRLSNGYRLYSESDLLKLQQILVLKFLRFELKQIKDLMVRDVDINELKKQLLYIEKEAKELQSISLLLKQVITDYDGHQNISWEEVIKKIDPSQLTKK